MAEYTVKIVHLYPNLLNLYGDKGNIECMRKRLIWRGIDAEVEAICDDTQIDFQNTDIIFLGGGCEKELKSVAERLLLKKAAFKEFAENGGTIIGVCEGFELLGNELYAGDERLDGLGVLDIYTKKSDTRFTGNVILQSNGIRMPVVGFENHSTKTDIGNLLPLGEVLKGKGNDGSSGYEGAIYKNVVGTHLHGPLFPKNPQLCDRILLNCLKNKYSNFAELAPIDDGLEELANQYIVSFMK